MRSVCERSAIDKTTSPRIALAKKDIFCDGEYGDVIQLLVNETETMTLCALYGMKSHDLSVNTNFTLVGRNHAGDHPDESRLSRSVLSDEANNFTRLERARNIRNRRHAVESL